MNDQLDRRIRDLYAELAEATPPLPPLPGRAPAGGWFQRLPALTLAAAALVAVVVATAGVLSVTSRSDDAGDASAASTSAPTTTAAAETTSGEAAETTAAPGTVPLSALEALGLQCASFADAAGAPLGRVEESVDDHEMALDVLEGELFGLRTTVIDLPADDRATAEESLDALGVAIANARGSFGVVAEAFAPVDEELTNVASVLADLGAAECGTLADLLP